MDNSDDDFSDDGFDSLPAGTLLQLEQNAYQATQAPGAQSNGPSQTTTRTVQDNTTLLNGAQFLKPPSLQYQGLSSEYVDMDVGDLDAEVFEENGALEGAENHGLSIDIQARPVEPPAPGAFGQFQGQHYDGGTGLTAEQQLRAKIEEV
jgi:hypothetical protein